MKLFNNDTTNKMSELDYIIYTSIKNKMKLNYEEDILKIYSKEYVLQRKKDIKLYMKQLNLLKKIPLIKQRTDEWYEIRKTRLTASDLDEAIGKNNLKLAKKKAGVLRENINYATIAPLKWGVMFEEMASRCYSQLRNDIHIYEFGLIVDNNQKHFGASPDGINEMGIMIEIKCPYCRKILDNSIPHKYYMQIQGQLATCNLKECDYIECDFETFDSIDSYKNSIDNNVLINHGIICEYKNKDGEYHYIYSDKYLNVNNVIENIQSKKKEFNSDIFMFIRYTPWKLKHMNIQRVLFDEIVWSETVPKIDIFWEKVENCKTLPVEEVKQKQKIKFIEDD